MEVGTASDVLDEAVKMQEGTATDGSPASTRSKLNMKRLGMEKWMPLRSRLVMQAMLHLTDQKLGRDMRVYSAGYGSRGCADAGTVSSGFRGIASVPTVERCHSGGADRPAEPRQLRVAATWREPSPALPLPLAQVFLVRNSLRCKHTKVPSIRIACV